MPSTTMPPLKALALCFSGGAKATKDGDDFSFCDIDSAPSNCPPPAHTHTYRDSTLSPRKPPFCEAPPPTNIANKCETSRAQEQDIAPHEQPRITFPSGPLPHVPPAKASASDEQLETMLLESMPLSLAVISSDAKKVIYHRFGLDHGAAQLLKQTLQFNKRGSGAAQASGASFSAEKPADKSSSTFMAALLGPEIEAVALREARKKRFWKGTVSVQLPSQAPPSEISGAHSSARQSPTEVLPMPPASMAAARNSVCSAPLPELQARYASGQSSTLPGPDAPAVKADAAIGCTSFSVLKVAAKASEPETRDTLPTELSHGASTSHQNEQSSKGVQWMVPGEPEGMRSAFESSVEASTAPGEVQSRSPPTSEEHHQKSSLPGPELSAGSFVPLGRRSCPGFSSSFLSGESDVVEDKDGTKKRESSFKEARRERRRPAAKKCKSAFGRMSTNRSSLLRPEAIEQLVHESKNAPEECTRTVALLQSISQQCPLGGLYFEVKQQAGRNTADGAHPCVSAPHQCVGETRSDALPQASPWADLRSFLSEQSAFPQGEEAQQHKIEASDLGQHGQNVLRQLPTATSAKQPVDFSRQAASSATQTASDQPTLDVRSSEQPTSTCPTTDSIPVVNARHSLQACSSEQGCHAVQDPRQSGIPNSSAIENGENLVMEPDNRPSLPPRPSPAERVSGASSQTLECLRDCALSFDVTVSMCKPEEGSRSPLLVVICNSTEHSQVRTTLTALAESQLELLSSALPQHAIQFLAMESAEAVPEHVGQLARAHQDVTIMFMDIVGFTEMSKNCKPVEVMVFLNTLFSNFDRLVDIHGVHKVETAGDCYIVSGGIMSPNQPGKGFGLVVEEEHDPKDSARRVMEFAKSLLETAGQVRMPDTLQPVRIRVGLHTGDVVTGLIGSKLPKFSVFGDTMNTAARMESTGLPGRIHVSEATHALLEDYEQWEATGGVQVKGKGLMNTYLWAPSAQQPSPSRAASSSADKLPCMLLMHAHTLLRQFSSSLSSIQKLAARSYSTPASPSNPPSKHLGQPSLLPAMEVDEHELEHDE